MRFSIYLREAQKGRVWLVGFLSLPFSPGFFCLVKGERGLVLGLQISQNTIYNQDFCLLSRPFVYIFDFYFFLDAFVLRISSIHMGSGVGQRRESCSITRVVQNLQFVYKMEQILSKKKKLGQIINAQVPTLPW